MSGSGRVCHGRHSVTYAGPLFAARAQHSLGASVARLSPRLARCRLAFALNYERHPERGSIRRLRPDQSGPTRQKSTTAVVYGGTDFGVA
jgi:hypothetical protein